METLTLSQKPPKRATAELGLIVRNPFAPFAASRVDREPPKLLAVDRRVACHSMLDYQKEPGKAVQHFLEDAGETDGASRREAEDHAET